MREEGRLTKTEKDSERESMREIKREGRRLTNTERESKR